MANPDAWLAHLGPDGAPANSSAYQAYAAATEGAARRAIGAHPSDALIDRALNLASRDGRRGASHTGVRAWKAFAQDEGVSMARPMEAYAPLGARLHEELLAMPTVIRTMGRWSSDIYNLYVRASFERCVEWTRRAGSATVTDVAQVYEFDEVEHY
jgi:hypothetical protein